jgi:hypothetical protein
MGFDRYSMYRNGEGIDLVPFGEVPKKNTDRFETYKRGKTRLDLVSYEYYGTPEYAWLILQANPQYGSLEFNIPDGVELRIPYPLDVSLETYRKSLNNHNKKYK